VHQTTNMNNPLSEYTTRITAYSAEKQNLEKKQKNLPLLRLVIFLLFAFLVYRYLTIQSLWAGMLAISAFVAFVILSLLDSRLKKSIKRIQILIHINEKEVKALAGDYTSFDPGNEFINQSHDYTHDLDIFGEGSLFQFINRTSTIFGKLRLAEYFSNAFGQSDKVIQRQQAVKELSEMVELRQKLQLIFHDEKSNESDKTEMTKWLQSESPVKNLKLLRILAYGLPAITLTSLMFSIAGIMAFPSFLIVLQLMIVFLYARQTMATQNIITSKTKILNKFAQSLLLIEETNFKSDYLTDIQKQLVAEEGKIPSKAIRQLSVILNYMDSNLNILVSIILNGLFMFNLHLLLKVEKWKKQNQENVPNWFESIATFDAMSSLANFAYNNNQFIYPDLISDNFGFVAENLGHPLIEAEQRVVNDIEIKGWNQFAIITGANMSGKSTFLRTIGANYILAMAGAPVCASKLSFFPIEIHSSIRTSDSLVKHESYFYAELKRLKQIIDELESGKKKLILLDEILKGTNSKDKQAGSIALIEQLLNYKSVGLFATHDLMLGELATRFPGQVNNLCFEIQIENDKMLIDYKLHDGVCKNLNATYLMKNMGILFEQKTETDIK
jgi:DNA mismatch repair ATPase MutS